MPSQSINEALAKEWWSGVAWGFALGVVIGFLIGLAAFKRLFPEMIIGG